VNGAIDVRLSDRNRKHRLTERNPSGTEPKMRLAKQCEWKRGSEMPRSEDHDSSKQGVDSSADEDSGRLAPFLSPYILQNGPRRPRVRYAVQNHRALMAPGRSTEST
jgi:hypothetical protein